MAQIILDNVAPQDATIAALALKADLVGGTVPQAQLPSYVDDILEFADLTAFPATGETGKIYIAIDTGKQYRWSGSAYAAISNGFIASTSDVPEGSNLYFTTLRVLTTLLTGFSTGADSTVLATDTLAQALAKIQGQINARATTSSLTSGLAAKTDKLIVANRQTSSYTLVAGDADLLVEMNVGSANNLTVPLNSSVAFAIGTQILLAQYGAGQTTVVATGGVTIRSNGGKLKLTGQYSGATLIKIAQDEWYLFGDITT